MQVSHKVIQHVLSIFDMRQLPSWAKLDITQIIVYAPGRDIGLDKIFGHQPKAAMLRLIDQFCWRLPLSAVGGNFVQAGN